MAHDNFFGKMAKETQALFDIADAEAPDFTLHLHGGGNQINEVAHPDYMPLYVKELIQELKMRVKSGTDKIGLRSLINEIREDNVYPPRTFNLYSAMHFVCGTVSVIYESNEGIDYSDLRELDTEWETIFTCEEILDLHHILFEQTIKFALDLRSVKRI
jgi:hypothetical protein